jgi:hypothetical protein
MPPLSGESAATRGSRPAYGPSAFKLRYPAMAATAVHLVDHVIPRVLVRQ